MRAAPGLALALASALVLPATAGEHSPAALAKSGHLRRARALAEERLRADPRDAEAHYVLARYRQAAGDLDAALPLAEKACELDPRSADSRYLLAGIYGQQAQRASVFGKLGLARRFKQEAESAIGLDPRHVDARMGLIQFHLQAPGIAGGDREEARRLAAELARIDPASGYLAQIRIAEREERNAEVPGLYQKLAEVPSPAYRTLLILAGFYATEEQKQYERAAALAAAARALEPDRAGAYSVLATIYALERRGSDLDALLAEAESNVPDSLAPYYAAARTLVVNGGDLGRAERYLRKYLTMEPEPGPPSHAHAWWRLGNVLDKQGRKPQAVEALATALRLDPSLEEARKDLKRLKS
jgi:tetratricopeptide (TPR) repeat protein